LWLSTSWIFCARPADPATMTLATGVVARQVIETLSGVSTGLKWPNDLLWQSRKLGGILVELDTSPRREYHIVIGVGINVDLPDELLASIGSEAYGAVDIRTAASGVVPDRTTLAAALCKGLGELFGDYERQEGFAPYREAWRAADQLRDAQITVQHGDAELHGTARGIDDEGALLVSDATGRMHRILSGDVSVRSA
jgi:BirA family transcriptional regulator, biotin operon repressor / biotin---[acetyl-CoA-carboxylase] ligase